MAGRFKRKGKKKFLMLEGYLMRAPAWRALTPNERSAYLEVKWRYDAFNNGRIGLGNRELAGATGISKDSARRALDGLVEKGFIVKAKPSGFSMKSRMATEWRLTEYPCDVTGETATKDFMRWEPAKKQQAHQKDTQAHHRDSQRLNAGQQQVHRRVTGTVKQVSSVSQAHHGDTYRSTIREGANGKR